MSPESSVIWHTRGVAKLLADGEQLVLDHAAQQGVVGEDRFELLDALADVGELGLEVDARQAGELAQLHVEDVDRPGSSLNSNGSAISPALAAAGVVAGADEGDDLRRSRRAP